MNAKKKNTTGEKVIMLWLYNNTFPVIMEA